MDTALGRDRAALIVLRRPRLAAVGWVCAAAVPCAFMAVFFIYPVAHVVGSGLGSVIAVAGASTLRSALWFTVWQAAASTALTVVIGLGGAAMVARLGRRARRVVRAVVAVPFVLPTVVVAGAFEALFDRFGLDDGPLRLHHTVWAVLAAHVFFNYAVVVRIVGSWWAGIDGRSLEAASVLGAGPRRTFALVTWPQLRPAVVAAAAVTFLFSFTSFGVVLILGGPSRATLETEIYRYAITRLDFPTAAALALVQVLAVTLLVAFANAAERRRVVPGRGSAVSMPQQRRTVAVHATVGAVLLGLPVGVLVERAFATGGGYGLDNFRMLTQRLPLLPASAAQALGHSFAYATLAMTIAVAVGSSAAAAVLAGDERVRSGCARRGGLAARMLDLVLTLPLGVSAVTVGLGMLLALDTAPLDLRTKWWIIPVAHALVGIPFVVRTLVPTLRAIDVRLREAAAVLGASPLSVRRTVDLPVASRAVAVGAAFAFAVSLGEFGATAFLPRRPDTLTAPTALFRLLGSPGAALRGQAMALAVVLMAATAASVLVIEGFRREDTGSF